MASVNVQGSVLGNQLQELLMCDAIIPGVGPSYQTCKTIYEFHVLGAKLAEAPIKAAQSQPRTINVSVGPEDALCKAFVEEWDRFGTDKHIFNCKKLSRVYGIASLAVLTKGEESKTPLEMAKVADQTISVNVLDPLNTAGSLVLSQDPNSLDFQKHGEIAVSGQSYHRSRTCTILNEEPIYIGYTVSAFGFVGRSVFQRALFPLKSFIQTLRTDDMVVRKAGLLVAMMKGAGSIIDNVMAAIAGVKRQLLKEAETNNVLSIDVEEKIETLNMQNLHDPYALARGNILKNIATSASMPAIMLENETLTEGFGEGTEDAKMIAEYVRSFRIEMKPLYDFFDPIIQRRAWNKEFYKTIQAQFPEEYGEMPYEQAFYEWVNSFAATWPSLLVEPESEEIKVEETKYKSAVALLEVLLPQMDPEVNRPRLIGFVVDSFNTNKRLFPTPLILDMDALAAYTPPVAAEKEPGEPQPFSQRDSDVVESLTRLRIAGR